MRSNVNRKIIIIIICIQFLSILFISIAIAKKNKFTLKKTKITVSSINKDIVKQDFDNKLKYYWDYKVNQENTWLDPWKNIEIINKTNKDGLSDTNNYEINHDNKTYRIVTLGDSFTEGVYLETRYNWTELLENKLNEKKICKNIDKFEIINMGIAGYDPEYEVEIYKQKGQKYNPELIIWLLIDYLRINEIQRPLIDKCTEDVNKEEPLKYLNKYIDCGLKIKQESIKNIDIINIQRKNISKIREYYPKKIFAIDFTGQHQEILKDLNNFYIFDEFKNIFLKNDKLKKEIFFPDGHPNKIGHQKISEIIFDQLFKTNQIPCDPM